MASIVQIPNHLTTEHTRDQRSNLNEYMDFMKEAHNDSYLAI